MEEKSLHAGGQEGAKSSLSQARQGLNKLVSGGRFADFDMARYGSSQSLGKEERLSRELLLDKLFNEGRSVSQNGFTLIYLKTALPAIYPAQAAFGAPKKHFRKATDRNRVKRLLREAYRKNKAALYQKLVDSRCQLALMLLYKGKTPPEYDAVEKNVAEMIGKLITKL